MTDDAGIVL